MTNRQRNRRLNSLKTRRGITTTGCWEWTGSVMSITGYSQYRTQDGNQLVHRMAYELLVGKIPDGFHVHHRCENRLCFRPEHLEVLNPSDHWAIGNSPSARRARQTHRKNGHLFDEANTWVRKSTGHRRCRTCHRQNARAYQQRRAA